MATPYLFFNGRCDEALEHIDRLQAMLWKLMH